MQPKLAAHTCLAFEETNTNPRAGGDAGAGMCTTPSPLTFHVKAHRRNSIARKRMSVSVCHQARLKPYYPFLLFLSSIL